MRAISLDEAVAIINACFAAARERKLRPLTAVILDAGGRLKAALKQDGCAMLRFEVAYGKAYAALSMGRPSRLVLQKQREKPVFMDNAITKVATPAATPTTENSVTSRSTAGRYGDRRYRCATNHSNRIVFGRIRYAPCASEVEDDSLPPSGRSSGKRMTSRIEGESVSTMVRRSMPMPSPAVGGMPWQRARM